MAGRPRTIDRDKVLDAAGALVAEVGAAGLSFEAVARAAGITKSGVQYCFGTKENMVRAMIERWGEAFEQDVRRRAGSDQTPRAIIRAHLEATRDTADADQTRAAVLMTALLERPEQVAATRDWYSQRLEKLEFSDEADRNAALALLAGEGAFFLKTFGLINLSDAQWKVMFEAMLRLSGDDAA